eukprot:6104797-Prymnesium_polylepis.1
MFQHYTSTVRLPSLDGVSDICFPHARDVVCPVVLCRVVTIHARRSDVVQLPSSHPRWRRLSQFRVFDHART